MLVFGTIKQYDAAKGMVMVNFTAEDIVSDWLPILFKKTLQEKETAFYDTNEHVACLMDENMEHGVCLGAIYSEADTPGLTGSDEIGIKFSNGDYFQYDRTLKQLKIKNGNSILQMDDNMFQFQNGNNTFKVDNTSGKFTISNGAESLKDLLSDLNTAIQAITVPYVSPSGPATSGVPNNLTSFSLLATRISGFFN